MATISLLGVLLLSLPVFTFLSISSSFAGTSAPFSRLQIVHRTCPLPPPRGNRTDCYDFGKCWCSDNVANCSNNHGSLQFVPRLPRGIQVLDLSLNKLRTIPVDFFTNVTGITCLVLNYNNLVHISRGAFGALKQLEVLIMRDNRHLSETNIQHVFEGYTLKCVDLNYGNIHALPEDVYNTSTLEDVFLFTNYMGDLNLSRFESMSSLRLLDWSKNYLRKIDPGHVKNLEVLLAMYNQLTHIPDMCFEASSASLLPRLHTLCLRENLIKFISSRLCLPELKNLELSGNRIQTIDSNIFEETHFPNLAYLYLQDMINSKSVSKIQGIRNYAFNNSQLLMISLMYNNIDFTNEDIVQPDSFRGCSNLTKLEIARNRFLGLTDERFHQLFGHLSGLQEISMFNSFLQTITVRTFARFPRLKTLRLYLNALRDIPDGAFAGNPCLDYLNINTNQLTTIRPTTFTEENRKRFKTLNLGGNPFVCDCELRWFSEWLARDKTIFPLNYGPYNCSNRPMKVVSFSMPDQACMLSRVQSQLIVVIASVVLLTAVLFSSIFRYRWHIRLILYEAFRGNERARRQRLEAGHFDYDVFVSYASEDSRWVLDHLMPELEDRLGLRLCVHERDFIPGKNIVDNISDCVGQSKKILVVFSRDFVRSQWCQFELAFCLRHVIENDDALIIVCLGDVASRDLTSTMMTVLKTTEYIQWRDDDDDALASFRGRLKIALREVAPLDLD